MEVFNNLCQATQRNLGSCFRSTLNRHLSADSIVPNPSNPQSFNRYSYVLNNPVNFTDPTGHRECGAHDGCSGEALPPLVPQSNDPIRVPFQAEDWEIQLLTMIVINEIAGQTVEQVEYATWTILNRYNAGDLQTLPGFESRIESILIGNPLQYHAAFGYNTRSM